MCPKTTACLCCSGTPGPSLHVSLAWIAVCVLLEMLLSSPSAYVYEGNTEIMLSCLILTWLI